MSWQKDLNPREIFSGVKGRIRFSEPLKGHATFKIGGRATIFAEPADTEELKVLIKSAKRYKIPVLVMGAGSNILAADRGVEALVLHLSSPWFKRISLDKNKLEAGSGCLLRQIILSCQTYGLAGAEFLAGIPGTLGGAVAMNAGITQKDHSGSLRIKSIGDIIENITVMDYNGQLKTINRERIDFRYRQSGLSRYIILSASLKLAKKGGDEVRDNIRKYLAYRRINSDLSLPNAGCVFRNPSGKSAGRLIDLCHLKGRVIGDARISSVHANFILNRGEAKAEDVLKLMRLIKRQVKKRFNLTLKPEIKIWK